MPKQNAFSPYLTLTTASALFFSIAFAVSGVYRFEFGIRAGLTLVAITFMPLLGLYGRALKQESK